jgi:hypothetical protein
MILRASSAKKIRAGCYERTRDLGTLGSIATWL